MAVAHSLSSLMYQICQFPNPFVFFFRRSESRLSLCLSCEVSFLFVFLGTVPKALARDIFLARQNNSSGEHQALLALLFCFVDKKNDIKTSCPKSKVEVLLLVLVLSPLYVYVEDMGKHPWTAGQPFMWIVFRPGLSLHFQVQL